VSGEPVCGAPNDVVVRVTASGLCHTDVSVLNDRAPSVPNVVLGTKGRGPSTRSAIA
jgi:Zn-dependent alcohol dehydrogenase